MGGGDAGRRGDRAIPVVVADASALIALERIGRRDLLAGVYGRVIVPPAVRREVGSVRLEPWILERPLTATVDPRVLGAGLHTGETEAIALATELGAARVVIDDRRARAVAETLGLAVVGTVGVIVAAKRLSLIDAVRPTLQAMIAAGFYVAPSVVDRALAQSGEAE